MARWDEGEREQGCMHMPLWPQAVFFGYTHVHTHTHCGMFHKVTGTHTDADCDRHCGCTFNAFILERYIDDFH